MNICVVGLGLMGGSLALAWRAAGWPARIVGVGRRAETLEAAQAIGAIDAGTTDLAEGVAGADVIILATPVRTILRQLPDVGRYAQPGALVLDLGSSKSEICAAMAALPAHVQPVGGHPLCGKEMAGFEAAEADMYRDRPFVLCPLPRTAPDAIKTARRLARAAGARPLILDPAAHDRAVATISHLPYVAAAALVRAASRPGDPIAWVLAASGFRDTSRLAGSDVEMMLDTLLTNREAVLGQIDAFSAELAGLRGILEEADEGGLRELLAAAREGRGKIGRTAGW